MFLDTPQIIFHLSHFPLILLSYAAENVYVPLYLPILEKPCHSLCHGRGLPAAQKGITHTDKSTFSDTWE